jgi:hypothetical protein
LTERHSLSEAETHGLDLQASRRAAFYAAADERYATFLASGEYVSWEAARQYLLERAAGRSVDRTSTIRLFGLPEMSP